MSRSTSNKYDAGGPTTRAKRKAWLVDTYRANVDLGHAFGGLIPIPVPAGTGEPACRCYRCGVLLTVATVSVDRRVPGCEGGTYDESNIRPACSTCNSQTGGVLGARRRAS